MTREEADVLTEIVDYLSKTLGKPTDNYFDLLGVFPMYFTQSVERAEMAQKRNIVRRAYVKGFLLHFRTVDGRCLYQISQKGFSELRLFFQVGEPDQDLPFKSSPERLTDEIEQTLNGAAIAIKNIDRAILMARALRKSDIEQELLESRERLMEVMTALDSTQNYELIVED